MEKSARSPSVKSSRQNGINSNLGQATSLVVGMARSSIKWRDRVIAAIGKSGDKADCPPGEALVTNRLRKVPN
ncbi:hypothetical protein ACN4EG_17380 [Alkalinema pantanalense CENA528]|uniref:hypothetical protein n=1 Tax=Alkalinema pantanalense TaxID=1620705 RepID=UPI003D6DC9AD